MDSYASSFWHSLGYARIGGGVVILLASVTWEAYLEYLEFDSRVFNVNCLDGTESLLL